MGKSLQPTSIINEINLHVPKSFEGILPVKSARNFEFEPHSFLGLRHSLREGDTALDVGSSYGVMSALIGKLVGDSGRCYSLEANSAVIGMARRLIEDNGLGDSTSVHNVAVSDGPGEAELNAVPGFQSTASTLNPEIRKVYKDAIPQKVNATTIDQFCSENGIVPRCIKIDIEGSECVAVRGARDTIKRVRPDLVIETHGLEILGVGGSVAELVGQLEADGYVLFDMCTGEQISAGEYARKYAGMMGTVLASARMSEADIRAIRRASEEISVQKSPEPQPAEKMGEKTLRGLVDSGGYDEAYALAHRMPDGGAEWNYLAAFAAHMTGRYDEALPLYDRAEELGFDAFWVHYNRGQAYISTGRAELGRKDLEAALAIDPARQDIKELIKGIR